MFKNRKYNDIIAFHKNLMLKENGQVYAMFEVPAMNLSRTDEQAKETAKAIQHSAFLELIPYHNGEILTLPMNLDVFSRYQVLSNDLADDTREVAEYMFDGTLDLFAEEMGASYEYRYFMVIPLKNNFISTNLIKTIKTTFEQLKAQAMGYLKEKQFFEDWYEEYEGLNDTLSSTLSTLDAKPTNGEQTKFINRYQYLRGLYYNREHEVNMLENSISNLEEVRKKYFVDGTSRLGNDYGESVVKVLPIAVNKDILGKVTNNPATDVTGETGAGKSFLAKLLFLYMTLMKSKNLYIDPKAEMRNQYLKVMEEYKNAPIPDDDASEKEIWSYNFKQAIVRYI